MTNLQIVDDVKFQEETYALADQRTPTAAEVTSAFICAIAEIKLLDRKVSIEILRVAVKKLNETMNVMDEYNKGVSISNG